MALSLFAVHLSQGVIAMPWVVGGFVGAAALGLFFGSGFLLLAPQRGHMQPELSTHDRATKVDLPRSIEPSAGAEEGARYGKMAPRLSSTVEPASGTGQVYRISTEYSPAVCTSMSQVMVSPRVPSKPPTNW